MSNEPQEKRRASNASVARWYLQALLKRPWLLLILLVSTFALQAAVLAGPLFLKQLFNIISSQAPNPALEHQLVTIVFILAAIYAAEWASRRIGNIALQYLELNAMATLTLTAFEYLLAHSQHFFSNQFTGTLTRRVRKFADAFETIIDNVMFQFLPALIFIAGAVIVLFLRNHTLGLLLAGWAIVLVTVQIYLARWRQPLREEASAEDSKVTGALADAISNQTTVTLFTGATYEQGLFAAAIRQWQKVVMRSWNADELIWAVLGLFMLITEISILWLAVHLWLQGLLSVGDFVLIQAYLITTFDRVVSINMNLRRFYRSVADAAEMVDILEQPHEVADLPHAKTLQVPHGIIEFREVDFGFRTNAHVLGNYQLRIQGGEKIALVGPSGAGKSTVTKLLLRLYDVNSGAVEIDGQNIRTVSQTSLRENIGYVPQEPILFHRTLMENIRYGRRDATDEEVIAAAKKAHAHEFISSFPMGYDTFVGERGVKLSGGERQRVAIARALLKNAPILVLDEATSSLDSESEHLIQEALDALMQGKTVIVIAHRLSTIMKMDRIVVMEQGKIVAQGTHDELLSQNGLYAKLWSIQAGGFLGGEEEPGSEA
jgi:ATP-binding cassette, subfamily B, bacterial